MNRFFLDPHKPLPGCAPAECQGCLLQGRLQCHFGPRALLRFFAIAFPPFIMGGIGIARVNAWLLLPWVALAVGYFGLLEIRVMCSHCPHYAEPGTKSLQCWANYGSPKLWQYRPGPMSRGENIAFFAGLVLIAGYPLAWLIAGGQWLLLALFLALVSSMAVLMGRLMCARCINFACPFNCVSGSLRQAFFARNRVVGRAWQSRYSR